MLYDHNASTFVLGCLMNNPALLLNEKYTLTKDDFYNKATKEGNRFHSIIFVCSQKLIEQGANDITEIEIREFVKNYPEQLEVLEDNDYQGYIKTAKKLSNQDNFEIYYQIVRKFSILRAYKNQGFDINEIYDEEEDDETERRKLNGVSIDDINGYFENKIIQIKKKFQSIDIDTKEKKAGANGHEILERFKTSPAMGLNFESKYLTTLWNGWMKKQLYIRSGDTSSGKSRTCLGDLSCVTIPEIYDIEKEKWVENPNQMHSGLYIGCEMELDEEVDPIVWSYISGVESNKITKGTCTTDELARVSRAIDILEQNQLYLCDMPSFNINRLEEKIKEHKILHNIEYVAFDYMMLNSDLVREFVENRGGTSGGAREDQILLELSKELKNLCKKYDVGILTGTQVNGDIGDYRNRDYRVLRGGKAVADKATGGSISMPITEPELNLVQPYIDLYNSRIKGFHERIEPNFVETVYKSRYSEFPKECKIFSYYNLGNMRKTEMFVTDKFFKPISNIKKTIVGVK